ncbi:MAG: hypothetical protein H6656_10235 [Ardenticatenaceae bacterium]|nr:hypothetical protein [Ardenticatenaceae bacterium]
MAVPSPRSAPAPKNLAGFSPAVAHTVGDGFRNSIGGNFHSGSSQRGRHLALLPKWTNRLFWAATSRITDGIQPDPAQAAAQIVKPPGEYRWCGMQATFKAHPIIDCPPAGHGVTDCGQRPVSGWAWPAGDLTIDAGRGAGSGVHLFTGGDDELFAGMLQIVGELGGVNARSACRATFCQESHLGGVNASPGCAALPADTLPNNLADW